MSNTINAEGYAGAGNRFLLFENVACSAWPALARELCTQERFGAERADGLLVIELSAEADARMTIYNADGGRPEACGNGLRCVGWHLARTRGRDAFKVETDAGVREVRLNSRAGDVAILDAEMGHVRPIALTAPWPTEAEASAAFGFDLGNPHCILLVEDERQAPVELVGRAMQAHANFPNGVNVGFLAEREGAWHLRVWERGVGETEACGTNACAAAAYLAKRDGALQHELRMRGGELKVSARSDGALELRGVSTHHGRVELALHGPLQGSLQSL